MNPLFELLRCPETGQRLSPADEGLVRRLLKELNAGTLRNRAGEIPEAFESALVTLDGARIYPIRSGIPVLLVNEAL
jgi:uncharacterized protein